MKALFGHDHTFIEFKDNYRCIDNFTKTNIAAFDNDDDHSDNPNDWVGISDVPKLFPGVPCIISTSRHHMKQKGDKGPRPRYHVMLLTDTITSPEEYTALLTKVQKHFPFFDKKALDAARFYFGNPDTEVYSFPGHRTLTEFIAELEEQESVAEPLSDIPAPHQPEQIQASRYGSIPEGSRNSTISHQAGKILKRWGDTPEAYEKFMEVVAKCSPPLPEEEVKSTWKSAVKFLHEKVEKTTGICPAGRIQQTCRTPVGTACCQ